MIAKNFRMYPEAQLLQLEILLSDEGTAAHELKTGRKGTFFNWLMTIGTVIKLPKAITPAWFAAMTARAKSLAKRVKAAMMSFF